MLNKNNERELAYVVKIDNILPIEGSDNCEDAHVLGWHVMVRKNTFTAGDLAIYFEIDSHLNTDKPCFSFLAQKKGNIKTQRYTFGGKGLFYSQGLLMSPKDFGWRETNAFDVDCGGNKKIILDENNNPIYEGDFLTKKLEVTYAVPEDNKRKSNGIDKYKKMSQRHPKLFSKPLFRWLMRRNWGKKLLFIFFGKKRDKKNEFPAWVKRTDEDRLQACPWIINDTNQVWYPTEKIDGSSTTFTVKGFGRKRQFVVCSRNVAFDKPDKKCYYDTNIYTEMAEKYDMETVLAKMLDEAHKLNSNIDFLTIQAETYGEGVQKRDYNLKCHDMAIFNIIWGFKDGTTQRLNPFDGKEVADKWGLPYVPVFEPTKLPNDCDAVVAMAGKEKSKVDGGMREGLVFRSEDGTKSFKVVDPEFLLKYHG